jgi:putative flippase GtrA
VTIRALVRRYWESRFLRFAFIGACGLPVNEIALAFGREILSFDDHAAWFFGFAVAVTFTWWGNRTLTFADKASSHRTGILAEWARFVATNSVGAAANFAVYSLCLWYAPPPVPIPYVALVVGTAVGLVFNFTFSKLLVFRS